MLETHPLVKFVPQIKEAMEDLRYGQFNLLSQDKLEIQYNPRLRQVLIRPFFGLDLNGNSGVCHELINIMFRRIRNIFPANTTSGLYVFRAEGYEPRFFSGENMNHTYLLLAPNRDLHLIGSNGGRGIYNRHQVPKQAREKWLVVDPCYKFVEDFPSSRYQLKSVDDEASTLIYSRARLLRDK